MTNPSAHAYSEAEAAAALLRLPRLPRGAKPLAILCIGQVEAFYPRPMFEDAGWGQRLPLTDILVENRWPEGVGGTPTAYA